MSQISFAQRYTASDAVLLSVLGGEAVILDMNSQYYYGLDDVGTRMWSAVSTSATLNEAFESLLSEFDVEAERLQADLSAFVALLLERGLLIGGNA